MKKLLGILVLGLLLASCSENNNTVNKIRNCADKRYFYDTLNYFKETIEHLKERSARDEMIFRLRKKEILLTIYDWEETAKKELKLALKLSTEEKINSLLRHTTKETLIMSESYQTSFSRCEMMRKQSPIMFDEKYKKKFKVK